METVFLLIMTFGGFDDKLIVSNIPTQEACVEKAKMMVEQYRLALPKDAPQKWRSVSWKCKVIYYRKGKEA